MAHRRPVGVERRAARTIGPQDAERLTAFRQQDVEQLVDADPRRLRPECQSVGLHQVPRLLL